MSARVAPPARCNAPAASTRADRFPPSVGTGMGLTDRQRRVFDYINAYLQLTGGICPSYLEIAGGAGLYGKAGVHECITRLEERGLIRRIAGRDRAIEIVDPRPVSVPTLNGVPLQLVPVSHRRP